MGQRRYPQLTLSEVLAILNKLGFVKKHQEGSHAQHERPADGVRPRSIVTVDMSIRDFDDFLLKSMIGQSNHSREEFYGATKKTAKKASVPFRKLLTELELD